MQSAVLRIEGEQTLTLTVSNFQLNHYGICQHYTLNVTCLCAAKTIKQLSLLGQKARLTFHTGMVSCCFSAYISAFELSRSTVEQIHLLLESPLVRLNTYCNQLYTEPKSSIATILQTAGLHTIDYRLIDLTDKQLSLRKQCNESFADFLLRALSELDLLYWFEQTADHVRLVIAESVTKATNSSEIIDYLPHTGLASVDQKIVIEQYDNDMQLVNQFAPEPSNVLHAEQLQIGQLIRVQNKLLRIIQIDIKSEYLTASVSHDICYYFSLKTIADDAAFHPTTHAIKIFTPSDHIVAISNQYSTVLDEHERYTVQWPFAQNKQRSSGHSLAQAYAGDSVRLHFPLQNESIAYVTDMEDEVEPAVLLGLIPNINTHNKQENGYGTFTVFSSYAGHRLQISDDETNDGISLSTACDSLSLHMQDAGDKKGIHFSAKKAAIKLQANTGFTLQAETDVLRSCEQDEQLFVGGDYHCKVSQGEFYQQAGNDINYKVTQGIQLKSSGHAYFASDQNMLWHSAGTMHINVDRGDCHLACLSGDLNFNAKECLSMISTTSTIVVRHAGCCLYITPQSIRIVASQINIGLQK